MTIVATNVNKLAIVSGNWSTTKTMNVKMTGSPVPTTASS
jgi:hypothetical protein